MCLVFGPVLLLFQSSQFAIELVTLGGQAAVASHNLVELFDLLADSFALGQELDDLARPAAAVEDAIARGFQFAHHFDQRDTVQAGVKL